MKVHHHGKFKIFVHMFFFGIIAGLQSSGDSGANGHCGENPDSTSSPGAGTAVCYCKFYIPL